MRSHREVTDCASADRQGIEGEMYISAINGRHVLEEDDIGNKLRSAKCPFSLTFAAVRHFKQRTFAKS